MNAKELNDYLMDFANVWLEFPFGQEISVYKLGNKTKKEGKIFALLMQNKKPLQISLKCDPLLSEKLRQEYETVFPAKDLSKKDWNTIILSGQVDETELKSLINHTYDLVEKDIANKHNN